MVFRGAGFQLSVRGPALDYVEVQTQELSFELLVPEIPGVRIAVQRLKKLADRVTEASGPVLGLPDFRETDVRLRPLHGSLDVRSDAVALQQLGVLH